MSETTKRDLNALREGLRLVEREYRGVCLLPAEDDPTLEARAWAAVAAVVRRELEALEAGEGEAEPLAWRIEYRGKTSNGWHYQSTCDSLKEAEEKVMRLRRGGVPLEYRIVPLYPAARRGEGGSNGLE